MEASKAGGAAHNKTMNPGQWRYHIMLTPPTMMWSVQPLGKMMPAANT